MAVALSLGCGGEPGPAPQPATRPADSVAAPAAQRPSWSRTFRHSVDPAAPDYLFTLIGERSDGPGSSVSVTAIEIRREGESAPVQMIDRLEAEVPESGSFVGFEVLDMNFDGFQDFRLVEFLPAGPNVPYLNWLFEPASGSFQRSAELDRLTAARFDAERRQVLSSWRDGASRYGTDVYEFVDGELRRVRREVEEPEPADSPSARRSAPEDAR